MLTKAQLEFAAREYCRLMGWDPDLLVYPVLKRYRWQMVVDALRRHEAMNEALRLARGEESP